MTESRLSILFQLCMTGQATSQEQEECMELLGSPENHELAKQLMQNWIGEMSDETDAQQNESASRIFQSIINVEKENPVTAAKVHRIHFLKTNWFRYAASALIILGAAAYFWISRQKNNNIKTVSDYEVLKKDIAPGTNKAILTLGDGSTVVLDSASNGVLAQQGSSNIIKSGSQLLYKTPSQSNGENKIVYNTLSTPRGGQYQLMLPDGSKVWLNAASSITYPVIFTGNERLVSITGEAYFEVAHNKNLPFRVHIPDGSVVEVLGTAFNINAYPEEESQRTTLIRGSVKITLNQQQVILKPGDAADVKGKIGVLENVDTSKAIAWKDGFFDFESTSLEEVMRQLARWYDIEVTCEGKFPPIKFGGEIPRNIPLSGIIRTLKDAGVSFKMINERHVLIIP